MKLYEKKVYECEHCGKISKSAGAMTLHERRCRKNPNIRPLCWKCKHCHTEYNGLEPATELIEWLEGYGYDVIYYFPKKFLEYSKNEWYLDKKCFHELNDLYEYINNK